MSISLKRRSLLLLSLLSALTLWSAQAAADYPEKSVRFVVPFPPGGSFDGPARLLATRLSVLSGKSFVVETRAGVGGALGAAEVSRAAPDGYTILLSNGAMPVSYALSKNLCSRQWTALAMWPLSVYFPLQWLLTARLHLKTCKN